MNNCVAVIGQGFVGGSLTTVLSERGCITYAYDKSGKYAKGAQTSCIDSVASSVYPTSLKELVHAYESIDSHNNIYFVCLPTPMLKDGSADLSIVENVLSELGSIPGTRIVVVKSTVPPGTTEAWNSKYKDTGLSVIFNPEFLTEANALNDMRNQNRIILGGPEHSSNVVKDLYASLFPNVEIKQTTSTVAELVKYVTNCFLSIKVSFANEIYQLCEALNSSGLDTNYDSVIECATLDTRLGKTHWKVPSYEKDENGNPLFGFSLSCFPKDINALIHKEIELGIKPTMLMAAWEKNLEVRPSRDWEKMLGRAVSGDKDKQ